MNKRMKSTESEQSFLTTKLAKPLLSFLILTAAIAISWPLIVQPFLRNISLLIENLRDEELAQEVKIQLPSIGLWLALGLSGISILFLLAGAIYTSTESWKSFNGVD